MACTISESIQSQRSSLTALVRAYQIQTPDGPFHSVSSVSGVPQMRSFRRLHTACIQVGFTGATMLPIRGLNRGERSRRRVDDV